MPHTISNLFKNNLSNQVTTNATLWKITRTDGEVFSFTNHTEDIEYNGTLYKHNDAIDISSIATKSDLSVDNMDLLGFLRDTGVTEEDIFADLFDGALVEILMIDYKDLSKGHLVLKTGYIGEIRKTKKTFTAEVRGLTQRLEQNFGNVYTPTCRARFGNEKCKINVNNSVLINGVNYNLTINGVVEQAINNRLIIDNSRIEPIGFFNFGFIKFTSGKNTGFKMEIKNFEYGKILLFLPMAKSIRIGDTYTMQAGCDKYFATCCGKFNNAVNFRGEPHLPGRDKIFETSKNFTSGRRYQDGQF